MASCGVLAFTFQLAASRGGRRIRIRYRILRKPFNSRPHEEVDKRSRTAHWRRSAFNSRPHEEADPGVLLRWHFLCLSTRGLTRRPTGSQNPETGRICLSTRGLTRRPTLIFLRHIRTIIFQLAASQGGRLPYSPCVPLCLPFNSRPHKEADPNLPAGNPDHSSFNSRPHKEADRTMANAWEELVLSTRGLTRRPTSCCLRDVWGEIFQLTASQGGRLQSRRRNWRRGGFQLTASQGGRRPGFKLNCSVVLYFQLTASQGGRR